MRHVILRSVRASMSVAIGRLHIFVFLLRGVEFEAPVSSHQRNLVYTNNWYNLAAKIGISRGTGMQLDQLRCFVTAAEELHFGRAAQRLGMLPSALGRFIRLLEQELKRFPSDLNRWDSQEVKDERVFVH
jgi:Bacterial regulatory helix-turn-helix protein, lysR family